MSPSIDAIVLSKGAHSNVKAGLCAMEAVAWLAGEPHSDSPECTSQVLAAYIRSLNDAMPDDQRQRLKPYLTKLLNTRDEKLDLERANVFAWASITEFTPTALHAIGLVDHATALRQLTKYDRPATAASAAASAAANASRHQFRRAILDGRASAAEAAAAASYAAASAAWSAAEAASAAKSAAWSATTVATCAASAAKSAAASAASAAKSAAASANVDVWGLALAALDLALEVK